MFVIPRHSNQRWSHLYITAGSERVLTGIVGSGLLSSVVCGCASTRYRAPYALHAWVCVAHAVRLGGNIYPLQRYTAVQKCGRTTWVLLLYVQGRGYPALRAPSRLVAYTEDLGLLLVTRVYVGRHYSTSSAPFSQTPSYMACIELRRLGISVRH